MRLAVILSALKGNDESVLLPEIIVILLASGFRRVRTRHRVAVFSVVFDEVGFVHALEGVEKRKKVDLLRLDVRGRSKSLSERNRDKSLGSPPTRLYSCERWKSRLFYCFEFVLREVFVALLLETAFYPCGILRGTFTFNPK